MADYTRTAQALAHTIDDPPAAPQRSHSSSPVFHRRSISSGRRSARPAKFKSEILNELHSLSTSATKKFLRLTPLQRILFLLVSAVMSTLGILFLVYNERIFGAMAPVAKKWRNLDGGWCILWAATFVVSFPPLIGYSSCVTLAGFVYGVPKGWLIAASGTVIGSTASFLVSRTILKNYVARLTANDKRFAALALTLKHDGLKLLIMIRLCPLPYSLSNGAMSTIPTVTWYQFLAAGVIASPKLILHVFVGSRLGAIAESGDKMDARTKAISYLSIGLGLVAGIATGWFMYTKTKDRAREIEAEEREAAIRGEGEADEEYEEEGQYQYSDDPIEREAAEALATDEDGYSMHTARPGHEYRDEFSSGDDESDGLDNDAIIRGPADEEQGFKDSAGKN